MRRYSLAYASVSFFSLGAALALTDLHRWAQWVWILCTAVAATVVDSFVQGFVRGRRRYR